MPPAKDVAPGTYRTVNGTTALALGLIAASARSGLQLVLASYPITPASELLHELSRHARLGVSTIHAEGEIAAAGMALGAAFGGRLGVTATSGPGMDLKAEMIGLAVMLELPIERRTCRCSLIKSCPTTVAPPLVGAKSAQDRASRSSTRRHAPEHL